MSKFALVCGILCLAMAVVISVLADGLRRWYSGIFFASLGVSLLLGAARWRRDAERRNRPGE